MRSRRYNFNSAPREDALPLASADIGTGVTEVKPGDRVAYTGGPLGAYSEARLIPAERLVVLPKGISDHQAAAMMLKGLTAQYLIRQTYRVKAGDTILFHAAAGGVGLIACQWAKHLGATVIGTVGNDEKAKLAKSHGCDHVIVYTREDFQKRVVEITSGNKVRVVYDSVGKDTFMKSLDCLAPPRAPRIFWAVLGPGRAPQSHATGAEGITLRHTTDASDLWRQARGDGRYGKGAFRSRSVGRGEDQYQPDLSIEGCGQGASRPRSAQDHRLEGAHDLGNCRYGAAPR
jgi:NADPH:quinone reductase-like Zn-dependent oxidoreductase